MKYIVLFPELSVLTTIHFSLVDILYSILSPSSCPMSHLHLCRLSSRGEVMALAHPAPTTAHCTLLESVSAFGINSYRYRILIFTLYELYGSLYSYIHIF